MELEPEDRLHLDARTGTGRKEHDLEITGVDGEIGRGVRGVVSRVRVLVAGKEIPLAAKAYKQQSEYEQAKTAFRMVRDSVARERREKGDARSSLLPTVRFDDAGRRIFMTLLGTDGRKVASVYGNDSPGRRELADNPLGGVPGLDDFLDRILSDVQERGRDGVRMGGDSVVFLVSKDGALDYATADLEGITYLSDRSEAAVANLVGLAHALEEFFRESTLDPDAHIAPLLAKVRARVDQWFSSQPLANPYKLRRFLDELKRLEDDLKKRRGGVGAVLRGMLGRIRGVFGG